MAKIKVRGESGAAKNYITRNQALKKLQCTLSDFRRLCILKGIFPREPRNKKKANKGSSAPTTFYYIKDITYLLHEPVLQKLREHKAFAKKISKALGRGEWGAAQNLQDVKPVYRLEHIVKERYPTFDDALRDLSDCLNLIALFSYLPRQATVPPAVIEECSRIYSQWLLYILKKQALRKVFISIKGIYYEARINNIDIRWLVPHLFVQNVPADVDFRIMMTYLELYRTMLQSVLLKLYTDINLVYPPPLDVARDGAAAGLSAFSLVDKKGLNGSSETKTVPVKKVTAAIQSLTGEEQEVTPEEAVPGPISEEVLDVFEGDLPTLATIEAEERTKEAERNIFKGFNFFLSREVPRGTFEFVIRCFGGQVGWDESAGEGSPYTADSTKITHYVIDRPSAPSTSGRIYIQPQWVVDCVNQISIVAHEAYAPGQMLPPHLSPFVDRQEDPEEADVAVESEVEDIEE